MQVNSWLADIFASFFNGCLMRFWNFLWKYILISISHNYAAILSYFHIYSLFPLNYKPQITYTLMGCAVAVVLISIVVGLTYFFRARHTTRSKAAAVKKSGWAPVSNANENVQPQVPLTGPVHPSGIVERPPVPKTATLEVIINPATHRKEFEEMEDKFCFYDRKVCFF